MRVAAHTKMYGPDGESMSVADTNFTYGETTDAGPTTSTVTVSPPPSKENEKTYDSKTDGQKATCDTKTSDYKAQPILTPIHQNNAVNTNNTLTVPTVHKEQQKPTKTKVWLYINHTQSMLI